MPPACPTRRGLLVAGAALLFAGCGSQPPRSPPTGVDGLVVPTPSPRASDFGRTVANRYLPLVPGRRWTYVVTGRAGVATRTATVLGATRAVAGVATTVVRTRVLDPRGRVLTTWDDAYAADRAGNVWWFAHTGPATSGPSWTAGTGGAEAGLVVPAAPRVGDGFATAEVSGRPVSVATVISRDAGAVTPYRTVRGALRLEVRDPATGRTTELVYAAGLGPVSTLQVTDGTEETRLTALTG